MSPDDKRQRLVVGLGNPGYQYHLTPHNLGFMAADRVAEMCGVEIDRPESQALVARAELDGVPVVLAKPQTYMNLSGLAVARLLCKWQIAVEDLIVLTDDVALPLGTIRIRPHGSAGGHNGLKSVIGSLQSEDFARVRMGVQPEHPISDLTAYVLGRFRKADLETVAGAIDRAAEAVSVIVRENIQTAMNRYNGGPPLKTL